MKPLEKAIRNQLEKAVKDAREVAEKSARIALEQLGVAENAPFSHVSEAERELRRKLRAHGRQLGDSLNGDKIQTMDRLIEEVAYEHWHRMLFARFLAENGLLVYPDPSNPVSVSLEECEDLAEKEGAKNGWELASRFAARMLPQIFRLNSPVFQLSLPPEYQQRLEQLIDGLPDEIFVASDSIGWVYQFWQSKKKDEVNASEVKIGAHELSAVTQIFTEPYMVSFLLDNSLGAWWAEQRLSQNDFRTAESEEELRNKIALDGVPLAYLRFVGSADNGWHLATDKFTKWPTGIKDLKILDPCCGSGHFLVAALLMLVPMRMELERISAKEAVDAVLRENLHGLEIDQRCVELAAFAIALASWRYPGTGGYRQLPELNVACSGLSTSTEKDDWLSLAKNNPKLSFVLEALYDQFKEAPSLGSLINPKIGIGRGGLIELEWKEVAPLLNKALSDETDSERKEIGVAAQGIASAAQLLAKKYHLVVTNVPYLARGRQNDIIRDFCESHYSIAKNDLSTVFLERCLNFCVKNGAACVVLPQNWLFLTSYKKFRIDLLTNDLWLFVAKLGPGAFETISGEVVKAILLIISNSQPNETNKPFLQREKRFFSALDVSESKITVEKAAELAASKIIELEQQKQLDNPDARITLEKSKAIGFLLEKYAECYQGLRTGEKEQFLRLFWELGSLGRNWDVFCNSNNSANEFGGMHEAILWENGKGKLHKFAEQRRSLLHDMHESGNRAWGKRGVAINQMEQLKASHYVGEKYDGNVSVIFPTDPQLLPAIWCFCSSPEYYKLVRSIDQKMNVTNATLTKVPFDVNYWVKIANEQYLHGLPKPYSDDPTQWIFHGHPAKSYAPLQVAVARLLGYRWPAELDNFIQLSDEARALVKKSEALSAYADDDGIVCIPSVRGEAKADERLENLLAAAYGSEWSPSKKSELLAKADYAGKTLESWLREKFFFQHCKLFQDRPFIWHIWDGLSDGFGVLVNYHKLDYKLLETLIYTYLGDWISHQKQDKARGVDGAEEKLSAAEILKKRLELILEGELPYDIFVRWKPIEQQPIGWNPDLNDGVRINIRPFMSGPNIGKKGVGVLRDVPNIDWRKDRGKDIESAPWFELGLAYEGREGDRINDHHLSLSEKKEARKNSN